MDKNYDQMKTFTVGEFKTRFSEVIEMVRSGKSVAVMYGRRKELIGIFQPKKSGKGKRKIGILKGKMSHQFSSDFKFKSEIEFLGL